MSGQNGLMRCRPARVPALRSGFAGVRFPPRVIMASVHRLLVSFVELALTIDTQRGPSGAC